jgi:hypothetical protein
MLTCTRCGFKCCNKCRRKLSNHSNSRRFGKRPGMPGYISPGTLGFTRRDYDYLEQL